MAREDHNQIQVMPNGDIILNTENHGVMFFNKSKLIDEQHEQLSLTDLETVIDQRDTGYSATCVFTNHEGLLTILVESENA